MNVAITGASGMVGKALAESLETSGGQVRRFVRAARKREPGTIAWNPETGKIDRDALEGVEGVVHLAGENIAAGRWTGERKRRIRESRVGGTTLLSETLAALERRPRVMVAASAIGFYGDRGDELLTEESARGQGFLPDVAAAWEESTAPASAVGIRVVNLRIGIVLSKAGGALAKMLTPFRMGLGGPIGDGTQYMSWIALDDLVRIIEFALAENALSGPVNAVAPNPVTNAEFGRTLGRVLGRPAILPAPKLALRLALGEMANELLLSSTRVLPQRLEEANFAFTHPTLNSALNSELGTSP
jgi:uncharacterized protein (TIGR01777 family)